MRYTMALFEISLFDQSREITPNHQSVCMCLSPDCAWAMQSLPMRMGLTARCEDSGGKNTTHM